ncbi:MAG: hypothetical protein K2P51_00045 [Rhabdochlamydiaceae bacterium]|nr:hypothetical protein [Rhabdochlamydiaceae bacterium]
MFQTNGSVSLLFPSHEVMFSFLNNHPALAQEDNLKEKGVFAKTAQVFENTTQTSMEIKRLLVLILDDIGLERPAALMSLMNLSEAVEDCALAKVFGSAKVE